MVGILNGVGCLSRLAACTILLQAIGLASTISISTGSNWTVTAGGTGAVDVTPFVLPGNIISLTSDSYSSGTFVSGGSAASFNNFWLAQFDFTLPSVVSSVDLTYFGLAVDDRAVVLLNGVVIAAFGLGQTPSVCAVGSMMMSEGAPNNPFNFCSARSGVVTSGFNLGGTNRITAIINNTNTGIVGDLSAPFVAQNSTGFIMLGAVNISETPEPGSAFLIAAGALALSGFRRYVRRSN